LIVKTILKLRNQTLLHVKFARKRIDGEMFKVNFTNYKNY